MAITDSIITQIADEDKSLDRNAMLRILGNMTFLNFFNSKAIYAIKGFDTPRKARNHAKKYGYTLFETLPDNVKEYDHMMD